MDTQTRHALQHDSFSTGTLTGIDWILANRTRVIRMAVIALVAILAIVAAAVLYNQRAQAANNALGNALSTYNTPIVDAGQQVPPGVKTFANSAERAKASNPLFADVARKFGSMGAGQTARYFAGLTAADLGRSADAESDLRKAADAHNGSIASLAKLALANLLAQSGRTSDAVKLYQDLISHPTTAVPAGTAQLQLAQMYQVTNPGEATRILTTLRDKDKTSEASRIASQLLAGGK